jgi:hypothetical protein
MPGRPLRPDPRIGSSLDLTKHYSLCRKRVANPAERKGHRRDGRDDNEECGDERGWLGLAPATGSTAPSAIAPSTCRRHRDVVGQGAAMTSIRPELWVDSPRDAFTFYVAELAAVDHHGSNTCSSGTPRSAPAQNRYRRRVVDSPSMRPSSSSVSEKPNTSKLAAILSGVADLGITTTPCSMCQRTTT